MYGNAFLVIVILAKCQGWSFSERRADRGFPRRHGRHQHTGRRVVRLQILLHEKTAHRVTDDNRQRGQAVGNHTDVLDDVATEHARSGLSVGLLPWPRRLSARAR